MTPVEEEVPFQVTIHRGIGGKNVERYTFQSEGSNNMLEVHSGLPTRAQTAIRSTSGRRRAVESDFGPKSPNADTSGTANNGN